jgi:hypothetical protein
VTSRNASTLSLSAARAIGAISDTMTANPKHKVNGKRDSRRIRAFLSS